MVKKIAFTFGRLKYVFIYFVKVVKKYLSS